MNKRIFASIALLTVTLACSSTPQSAQDVSLATSGSLGPNQCQVTPPDDQGTQYVSCTATFYACTDSNDGSIYSYFYGTVNAGNACHYSSSDTIYYPYPDNGDGGFNEQYCNGNAGWGGNMYSAICSDQNCLQNSCNGNCTANATQIGGQTILNTVPASIYPPTLNNELMQFFFSTSNITSPGSILWVGGGQFTNAVITCPPPYDTATLNVPIV